MRILGDLLDPWQASFSWCMNKKNLMHGGLLALGGGGATHGLDPALDDFALQLTAAKRPALGFIGWASEAPEQKAQQVRQSLGARVDWVGAPAADDSFAQSKKWLASCDVIYVAGGDTLRLLEALQGGAWRNSIAQALERGLLLVGVSAGASVWFDSALSDAGGQGLRPLKGLGLFRGSFCPHYQNEAERRPAFERAIAQGHLPPGYGADDGAALWLTAGGPQAWRSAREGACIWRVSAEHGSYPCFGAPEP